MNDFRVDENKEKTEIEVKAENTPNTEEESLDEEIFCVEQLSTVIENIQNPSNQDEFDQAIELLLRMSEHEEIANEIVVVSIDNIHIFQYLTNCMLEGMNLVTAGNIFEMFTNCIISSDCKDILYNCHLYEVINQIIHGSAENESPDNTAGFIQECPTVAHQFLNFLNALSSEFDDDDAKNIDFILLYWTDFLGFLMIAFEISNPEFGTEAIETIYNLLVGSVKFHTTIIYHGFIPIAYNRFKQILPDFGFISMCFKELFTYDSKETMKEINEDFLGVFISMLGSDLDDHHKHHILKVILAATHNEELRSVMKSMGYIDMLVDFSENSAFCNRKVSLKILLKLLNDESRPPILRDYVEARETLDFLLPFFEVETDKIYKIIVTELITLMKHAFIVDESNPIFDAFNNSPEVMDYIKEISEMDDEEHDSYMVESAAFLYTEMLGNLEKFQNHQ